MTTTTLNEIEKLHAHGHALLAALVGKLAVTRVLEDLEGNELVLHAHHRRSRIVVSAWAVGCRSTVRLTKPCSADDFARGVAKCLRRLVRASRVAYGTLHERERARVEREHRGLEAAMSYRLARRDAERERARAARAKPRHLLERLRAFFLGK